ncbi:MAG: acyl carrier protein [Isosphaeraceae bacterium]
MSTDTDSQLLTDVARVLRDALGRDLPGGISLETRFFADLGLASIDAVVLGEALQTHYGRPLPFADLMAEIGTRADRDLTLAALVAFLRRNL